MLSTEWSVRPGLKETGSCDLVRTGHQEDTARTLVNRLKEKKPNERSNRVVTSRREQG